MDAKIDPMDETAHVELVDLIRRSDFTEAVNLFARLVSFAHTQGKIDAYVGVVQRVNGGGSLEDDVRRIADRQQ